MGVVRLTIAYDGGGFNGWAAQPGLRTVESELSAALERILGGSVSLSVAGRTDTGVHARGQVVSFERGEPLPDGFAARVNAVASRDLAVLRAEPAPNGFDARRDARSRTYCYRMLASPMPDPFEEGRALWAPYPLDVDALAACATALQGTHDFTAFTPTQTKHVRFERDVMRAEWRASAGILELWVEADSFMRHMVRVLVGTMLEVGRGRRDLGDFVRLLDGAPREAAGDTAQPHGLYLVSVSY
jgi:tRNA pseudouridine38-40 synthase